MGRHSLKVLWAGLEVHAGSLFFAGLGLVAAWNWYRWRQDLALAQKLKEQRPEQVQLPSTPKVSVLVAAWNEGERVTRLLDSFLRLDYRAKELVMAVGGNHSVDRASLAQRDGARNRVRLIEHPGEGKQHALQRCFEHASGELVFLTDADCVLDNSSFQRLIAPLVQNGEEVATGRASPLAGQRRNAFVLHQWAVHAYHFAHYPRYITGLLGRNCALTRRALLRAGAFNADVKAGTDYYLAKALLAQGYRIRYVPDSEVQTAYPEAIGTYWRQQARWLRNVTLHGLRFGSYCEVTSSVWASTLGLAMLLLPLTFPAAKRPAIYAWLLALLHGYLSRLRYMRFGQELGHMRWRCWHYSLAGYYMLVDFIAWSIPLFDYLLPSRRYRW